MRTCFILMFCAYFFICSASASADKCPKPLSFTVRGLQLSGVDWGWTDLTRKKVRFMKANFDNAFLDNAKMNNLNFQEAKFTNASLFEANFSGANIDNADFTNADLRGAAFDENTSVRCINLTNAKLDKENYAKLQKLGADLSKAKILKYTRSTKEQLAHCSDQLRRINSFISMNQGAIESEKSLKAFASDLSEILTRQYKIAK